MAALLGCCSVWVVYCGGLAYLVARWVILRQIADETGSA
jgi:hypothetical protein